MFRRGQAINSVYLLSPGLRATPLLWLCYALLFLSRSISAQESLESVLQQLATHGQIQIASETVYNLPDTQQLYANNGYAPLWNNAIALNELSAAIHQAEREGMNPADFHNKQVEGLLDGTLKLDVNTRDLLLTDSLLRLTYHYAFGKVDPKAYMPSWNFDRNTPQLDTVQWAPQVISNGGILTGLNRLKPSHPTYNSLVNALALYRGKAATGGWMAVDPGPTLRPGDRGPRVAQLRRRLRAENDLTGTASANDPELFDDTLEAAVRRFQHRLHLDADGVVGKNTLAAMNVPVEQRIDQIRVNLERARMLQEMPATAVIVDIAGFEVSLYRDGNRLLHSRAQVGTPYRTTPTFRDSITYIEFNPTWTVPPSILNKDVLPAIKRDPEYLQRKDMQVLTYSGEVVDPATVDWQLYPQRGFPYMLRQRPGPTNSLGRLKVMFPNEHMVYLHDTPNKGLFSRSERTSSSGCIRVEMITELAELLLDDPAWDQAAIANVINQRKTKRVSLRQAMPIYLVYWTVQVQDDGTVEFKRDPYERDRALLEALDGKLTPRPGHLAQYRPTPDRSGLDSEPRN